MQTTSFHIGACHYPEQFDPAECERDAALMAEAGFNVVRLGELIWSGLEVAPGDFRFDWLDAVLETFERHTMSVLLGTPTASLPPWLVELDPEVQPVDEHGVRASYGAWGAACLSSPLLQERTEAIVRALGERYGRQPAVIGWQIDNELLSNTCYCDRCRAAFHAWLEERYGSVEALNAAWGTAFWGHQYTRFSQVPMPLATVRVHHHNPALRLDYARFLSDQNVRYVAGQAAILRQTSPGRFLTHNIPGRAAHIDYFRLTEPLDVIGWDVYPTWIGDLPYGPALGHDVARGLKPGNFWVPEHQVGRLDQWRCEGLPAGTVRLWTYQAVAHGADGVLYFLWRAGRSGAEQYIAGIVSHDGQPARIYDEVARTAQELKTIAPLLEGTAVRADVAILHDYEDHWALGFQPMGEGLENPWIYAQDWYRTLRRAGMACDFLSARSDVETFSRYPLVLAPALYLADDDLAARLARYVEQGGVLVFGPRSGSKDRNNNWPAGPLPGPLAGLVGATVDEFESLPTNTERHVAPPSGEILPAQTWFEALEPSGADPVLRYTDGLFQGKTAAVRHRSGAGIVYYSGCTGEAVASFVLEKAMADARMAPVSLPEGLEVIVREGAGKKLLFLLNHSAGEIRYTVPAGGCWRDAFTGNPCTGDMATEPLGVRVLASESP